MATEQLIALGVALPLVLGRDLEQLALRGAVALADDQLEPPAGQVIQRRVVLVGADRVEQAEGGDGGEQPDPAGQRGNVTQHDGRGRGDERPLVPLPHAEAVESELLGELRVADHLGEPVRCRLDGAGHRVRRVHDQGDGQEPHDAARAVARDRPRAGPGAASGARPRFSRSVLPS